MPVAGGTGCECSHARSELLCSFPRGAIEALALKCQVTFELYRIYTHIYIHCIYMNSHIYVHDGIHICISTSSYVYTFI